MTEIGGLGVVGCADYFFELICEVFDVEICRLRHVLANSQWFFVVKNDIILGPIIK